MAFAMAGPQEQRAIDRLTYTLGVAPFDFTGVEKFAARTIILTYRSMLELSAKTAEIHLFVQAQLRARKASGS